MTQFDRAHISEVLLAALRHFLFTPPGHAPPQIHTLVEHVTTIPGFPRGSTSVELEVLSVVNELFRNGTLGWGHCLEQRFADPPYFHVTKLGRHVAQKPSRDPANPQGYMLHFREQGGLDAVSHSYIAETVNAYNAGCYKSAAVMVGGAAERLILNLRGELVARLNVLQKPVASGLQDWRVKTVRDAITGILDANSSAMPRPLKESYPMYWPSLSEHLRRVRNDAGHPSSIDPVTPELAHGNLLEFPIFSEVVADITGWIPQHSF